MHGNAAERNRWALTRLELLERLFSVESPEQPLPLRTAQEFADRLPRRRASPPGPLSEKERGSRTDTDEETALRKGVCFSTAFDAGCGP